MLGLGSFFKMLEENSDIIIFEIRLGVGNQYQKLEINFT